LLKVEIDFVREWRDGKPALNTGEHTSWRR
jgi:hypothetical protein